MGHVVALSITISILIDVLLGLCQGNALLAAFIGVNYYFLNTPSEIHV